MIKKLLLFNFLALIGLISFGQSDTIDLRGLDNEFALTDTISVIADGSVVILDGEMDYFIGSKRIEQSITIMTDPESDSRAQLSIDNNFWLGEVDVDSIVFDGLDISGGGYVFNNGNNFSVGKVVFNNCMVSKTGGLWRGKAAESLINEFYVNDCVLDSIGEYGILTASSTNVVENIYITNSTLANSWACIRNSGSSSTVTIDRVTINQTPLTGWPGKVISYSGTPGNLEISNSIFGPGMDGEVIQLSYDETAGPTTISVTNSYYTSDMIVASPEDMLPDLIEYTAASTDLWADPAGANFRIIDPDFEGIFTAGDPRWTPAQLVDITLSPGELPEFDPSVLDYSVELPWGTTAVIVSATPRFEDATVTGGGVIDVSGGSGTASIRVQEGTISQTYTINFSLPVGINTINEKVKMYFNPVEQTVVIDNSQVQEKLTRLDVYSISGKLVKNISVQQSEDIIRINTELLQSGVYILRGYYSDNSMSYLKFIR